MFELRDYQKKAVDAAISFFQNKKNGNAIEILPTGSGKSLIIANIVKQLGENVLVFQPTKEILEQNIGKLHSYGFDASIFSASLGKKDISDITFATIGSAINKKELFSHFKYIIVDECFPSGSFIDGIPIEKIQIGDFVNSFNHKTNLIEKQKVVKLFKKKVIGNLIKITLSDNTSFICTENHPIYTKQFGYIPAKVLSLCFDNKLILKKDCLYEQKENMELRCVRERMHSEKPYTENNLLQSGVCVDSDKQEQVAGKHNLFVLRERINRNGITTNKRNENRAVLLLKRMWSFCTDKSICGIRQGDNTYPRIKKKTFRKDEEEQPHVDAGGERKNDRIVKRENFFIERRKWEINKTTSITSHSNRGNNGISDRNSIGETFISVCPELLQSRFGFPGKENSSRGGRNKSRVEKMEVLRQTENGDTKFIRVANIEIYEQGNRSEFKSVCEDGFVYNIEVEHNHNYFVSGVLVHNCHFVNSKGGMYENFLNTIDAKVLGLTATPYRLSTDGFGGSILKFITRTRPRVFTEVIHYTQCAELFNAGYLAKLKYYPVNGFDRSQIRLNSTGADFDEKSQKAYYEKSGFLPRVVQVVNRLIEIGRKNIIVFTRFTEESQFVVDNVRGAAIVTAETSKKDREQLIRNFKSGVVKVVCNVGILNVGFDYPELETVVLAFPTMSLARYYQSVGRGMRPHPDKDHTMIVDMCGNTELFGQIESLKIVDTGNSKWAVMNNGKQLTNVYFNR